MSINYIIGSTWTEPVLALTDVYTLFLDVEEIMKISWKTGIAYVIMAVLTPLSINGQNKQKKKKKHKKPKNYYKNDDKTRHIETEHDLFGQARPHLIIQFNWKFAS